VQLSQLVERRARGGMAGEAVAGPLRLVQCIRPGAVHLHDLGAVHHALPTVGHQVRLRLAPVREGRGPFLRPAQVEDLLARFDHGAVDDPGDDRRDLAGGDGDHHLVQQCQRRGGLTRSDQRLAHAEPSERHQVRHVEAVTDRGGPGGGGPRGANVALLHVLQRDRHEQVALFHTVAACLVEHAARPCEPSATAHGLGAEQQMQAQPERVPRRARRLGTHQLAVRARRQVVADVVPAHQIGGRQQQLEVVRLERRLPVGRGQQLVGTRPLPLPVGGAAPLPQAGPVVHGTGLS
jgi:hypothetical protein